MKKIITLLLALAMIGGIATAHAMPNDRCPFDGNRGIWTGDVEVIDAQMYNVYRCIRGHQYLVKPY